MPRAADVTGQEITYIVAHSDSAIVIAENDHAMAFAGFGHRFPTIEIYSKSEHPDPWEQTPEEVRGMSDMIQAHLDVYREISPSP